MQPLKIPPSLYVLRRRLAEQQISLREMEPEHHTAAVHIGEPDEDSDEPPEDDWPEFVSCRAEQEDADRRNPRYDLDPAEALALSAEEVAAD